MRIGQASTVRPLKYHRGGGKKGKGNDGRARKVKYEAVLT